MATVKGLTSFKKKEGTLALVQDVVTWTPSAPANSAPAVIIPVSTINRVQATPATAAKIMLKIFIVKEPESSTPDNYVFNFTHPTTARADIEAMKDALTAAINAGKNGSGGGTPLGRAGTTPALAVASATAASKPTDLWNKSRLEMDAELQQSLLKSDPALSNTFTEAVLSGAVTAQQFWSTRTHLLRSHAIERRQVRGPYNVLAAIKSTTVDNVSRMSLSREQIRDIFEQHKLVKTVYDENVPRVSEDQFWSRFFLSRLFKKLKGEKILPTDPTDNIFDRYLNYEEEESSRKRQKLDHIPRILDLEGNIQDLSKKGGNKPDLTMRPTDIKNVPIIQTLNSLSQKLLDLVTPASNADTPSTDELFAEQRLQDLSPEEQEERIILNITDQRAFFSKPVAETTSGVNSATSNIDQHSLLDEPIDLSSITSPPSLQSAINQITTLVKDHSSQTTPTINTTPTLGLPLKIFDSVTSVHATSHEFLHHFWLAFLSGDPSRAKEITNMVTSLRNSKDRIAAIAEQAETERELEKTRKTAELKEAYRRTGIKPKKKDMEVGGGRKVVEELLGVTVRAVEGAIERYEKALQQAEAAAAVTAGGTPTSTPAAAPTPPTTAPKP
jgi:transcription initiation factor TFIIH subunit 1